MALTTDQILTLLQLAGCGRITTFNIANYASKFNHDIDDLKGLAEFTNYCSSEKIVKRLKLYSFEEFQQAESIAKNIIRKSDEAGIGIINYYENTFPKRLRNMVVGKQILSPILLHYKGNICCAEHNAVAIIGTREPTKEGVVSGEYIASYFAEKGFNIVSGLAVGCDTVAHRGALSVNGMTTAFLAHGLDTIYPKENKRLADEILEKEGLLLSEYPIGTKLSRNYLVERDRLQAGLAQATIVIQSGEKGGTMHAVKHSLSFKKPVYAVKYKSPELMNLENVRGNSLIVSQGGKFIESNNLETVYKSL